MSKNKESLLRFQLYVSYPELDIEISVVLLAYKQTNKKYSTISITSRSTSNKWMNKP